MPISITYWRDVLRKLTTTEMDNNFENLANAIENAGLSPTMPEGQIYIGDNTNTASLDTLDTSIVPETTDRNYQTDNQKLFNDATSSIQTQIDSKEPTISSGTTSQYWRGDKTWQTFPTATVPNLDEVTDVGNTTTNSIEVGGLVVDMPSGSGVAVNITKGGNEEGLKVHKTSGSGNVATITGGTTLISQLDLTTPLADSEIASAATWNGKFNTPTGLTTNNVSKWNGTGFVDSLLQSRNGLTIQNGTIIDCNTDAKSFFEFYPLIKNSVGIARFAFNFFPESDTNNTGFLNIIGITSGGDTVSGKKTLSSAIVINHQSTLQNNAAISIVAKTSGNSIWFPSDTTRGVIDIETNGDAFVARLTGSQGTQTRTSGFVAIINESAFAFSFKQKRTTTTGTLTEHARSMSTISSAVSNGWGTVSRHFLDVTGISNSFDIETKLINSTTGETAYTFRQTQWGGGSAGTKVIASFQGEGVVIGGESRTPSAQLESKSTTLGSLAINVLTTVQRLAITSPATGLQVFDSNLLTFCTFNGGSNIEANWKKYTTSVPITYQFAPLQATIANVVFNKVIATGSLATTNSLGYNTYPNIDPYLVEESCTITEIGIRLTQACVNQGTVGASPTVRIDVYRNLATSRTLVGTYRVVINNAGVGTSTTLGTLTNANTYFALTGQSTALTKGESIGAEFVFEDSDNNKINGVTNLQLIIKTVV